MSVTVEVVTIYTIIYTYVDVLYIECYVNSLLY